MKKINNLIYMFMALLLIVGCKHDEISRISPTGEFAVNFDFPEGEITAPSKLILVNRSRFAEKFTWNFPQGKTLTKSGLSDVSQSNKIIPDTIVYEMPGTYQITLTAFQGDKSESITKDVVVTKMKPQIIRPENIGILIEYEFSANVFSFPGQPVTYSWDFGEPGLTSTEAKPKVTFQNEGMHTITVTVNDGEEDLTSTIQVFVKGELSKAIYFTDAVTGKIYKYSLLSDEAERTVDLINFNTGVNPFGLAVHNGRIYVSEAGNIIRFPSNSTLPENVPLLMGDGKIYSVNLEGKDRVIHTENTLQETTGYQIDPFNLTLDAGGMIYWVIRNNGLMRIPNTSVNSQYPSRYITPAPADNGGTSLASAVDGAVRIVNNEIWMSKASSNGAGKDIFIYKKDKSFVRKIVINNAVKNFVVDTINNKIYYVSNFGTKGLFKCDINGANSVLIDNLANFSNQGGANEQTMVTGMALDIRPGDPSGGHLYLGFRHNDTVKENVAPANPNLSNVNAAEKNKSGIYRYELGGSNTKTFLIQGYAPYGLDIDHVLR